MLAVLALAGTAGTAVACGSSDPPLPKAAAFRGADCQSVAGPVVQVTAATRTLAKKPAAAGALASIADAQTALRNLPAETTTKLPEVGTLVNDIGVFRLRVDTHSADDGALRDLRASTDRVVRRCGG